MWLNEQLPRVGKARWRGKLLTVTDALGNVTSYTYDNLYRLTKITLADPDGVGSQASPEIEYEYDAAGRLTKEIDALDRETSYEYDVLHRLTKMTLPDPDGTGSQTAPVYTYAYDTAGNLTKETDPLGNETQYEYDNLYRLTKTVLADPDGTGSLTSPEIEYEYDAASQLTKMTDPLDRETTYEYDDLGRQTKVTLPDPDGTGSQTAPVYTYVYDAVGNVTKETDPLGNETQYEYDNLYRLTKTTLPDPDGTGSLVSPEIEYQYDAASQLTKVIDPLDRETSYEYDNLGRQTKMTLADPDGAGSQSAPVYTYVYDAVGNLTKETDALGNDTQYEYDNLYRTTKVTQADPHGAGSLTSPETEYEYDAASQLTKVTDPLDRETGYEYDDLGRMTKQIDPDPDGAGSASSPETTYTYDAVGNMLTVTDPLGNTTDYEYDNLYRQTKVKQPDPDGSGSLGQPTTTYAFDAVGNMTSLTDPVGNETTWEYDGLNRLTTETNELGDDRTYEYDAAGNRTKYTDRNGRVTEYDYDNLYRLTEERWKDGSTTIYTANYVYDAASQLTFAGDDFSSYAYEYDDLGRLVLTEIENGVEVKLAQEYDAAGNRTKLAAQIGIGGGVYLDDFQNTYTYDNLHRLTTVEQTGTLGGNAVADKRVDFAYNAVGQFTEIVRYDDLAGGSANEVAKTTYGYDGIGRLTDLTHKHDTTTIADYDWTYDAFSRVTSFTSPDGTSDYTYDDTGQLTEADHDYQTDEDYSYDENGNRTNTGYTTGDNNQLTSDGTWNYTYDDEGNRTKRTRISSASADDYEVVYEWDHHNRLTKITEKNNSGTVTKEIEYEYDVWGSRIRKVIDADGAGSGDAETIEYIYDGFRSDRGNAGDHIILAFDGDDALLNRYLHGPDVDQVLADEQFSPLLPGEMPILDGDVLWTLADNLGSVRDIVDDDGTVLNHIKYDSFGNITSESDPSIEHIFGYTGRERDEESELQYNRNRYYDAATGRWINPDPKGFGAGDTNLERYVGNSPLTFTDPSGQVIVASDTSVEALFAKHGVGFKTPVLSRMHVYEGTGNGAGLGSLTAEILHAMLTSKRKFVLKNPTGKKNSAGHLQDHVNARLSIINAAKNKATFQLGMGGFPDFGTDPHTFIRAWGKGDQSHVFMGCLVGTNMVILIGLADALDQTSFNQALTRDRPNSIVRGFGLLARSNGLPEDDWVPGDWGYIQNLSHKPLDDQTRALVQRIGKLELAIEETCMMGGDTRSLKGELSLAKADLEALRDLDKKYFGFQQGENILYLGMNDFWGLRGGPRIHKLEGWKAIVGAWPTNHKGVNVLDFRDYPAVGLR